MAEESKTSIERVTPPLIPLPPRARLVTDAFVQRWKMLPSRQRNTLVGTLLLIAGISIFVLWWSSRPDWRTLFSGLDARDLQQVEQQLAGAGISYQPAPDGVGLQVPAEQVDKARMAVAAKGMPGSGRLGFEIFDKPNWVGSEFDERVNYQRALEGELEHTIETIDVVDKARVHLVLPQQSYFAAENHPATASVVLKLRRPVLSREQTSAIRGLVAGAVENLHPDQVTLVDADGRTDLNAANSSTNAHEEESSLENKLVSMLEPLTGAGNVRATVTITYDQRAQERTDEVYDPQGSAILSVQRTEQASNQSPQSMPKPVGTASNTPGVEKLLPVAPQSNNGQSQTAREESSNYAVSRHMVHTQQGPGSLQKITAAILVNDREVAGSSGTSAWKQRTPEEMRRLEQLAQAAVGYDAHRGDSVVVQNIAFSENATAIKPSFAQRVSGQASAWLHMQPVLLRMLGMFLCAVLLVVFVLRPLVKSISAYLIATNAAGSLPLSRELSLSTDDPLTPQKMFERVANHVRVEQQHSARVLQSWIGTTEVE